MNIDNSILKNQAIWNSLCPEDKQYITQQIEGQTFPEYERLTAEISGNVFRLTASHVSEVYEHLKQWFALKGMPIKPDELREHNLLKAATARPFHTFAHMDLYPTAIDKAAALLHGIVTSHPYANANKRTGLLSCLVYLKAQGVEVTATEDAFFDLVIAIAGHGISEHRDEEVAMVTNWLGHNYKRTEPAPGELFHHTVLSLLDQHSQLLIRLAET